MDTATDMEDWLVSLRRDLHRRPEPAWREFYTTARIVEELETIGVDELHVGPDALAEDARTGVPSEDVLVDEIRGGLEEAPNGGQVADTARHDPEGRPVPHPALAEREPPPRREW